MALQISVPANKTNVGLPAPEAYAKVITVTFDANNKQVQARVAIYGSRQARDDKRNPVRIDTFTGTAGDTGPDIDSAGARSAVYTWLKQQPGYEGALDV